MAVLHMPDSSTSTHASGYVPIRMMEVEIGQPLPTLSAFDEKRNQYYQRARCLVRLHTQPLGLVELHFVTNELHPEEYAPLVWKTLKKQINEHLAIDGLEEVNRLTADGLSCATTPACLEERKRFLDTAPFVSVIVPTHERPAQLGPCLESLLAQDYPNYEIIVVDNAPETSVTADLIEKVARTAAHPVRYAREDRQGPSWARNCGIQLAKAEILAFTDDDVVVDAHWLTSLIQGFGNDPRIVCVTGLVLPLELETPAQFLFEEVGGYNKGYTRRVFSFNADQRKLPLHPYISERFGTGASMALTASFLRSIGGFDPALGRVGPVRCSQDIAVFFQVIARGHRLAYEPASLAYHTHRRDYAPLCKQTYNHSVGYTAFLTKSLLENPRLLGDFLLKVPFAFLVALKARASAKQPQTLHKYTQEVQELVMLRRKGLLYGPIAYLRSRWQVRKYTGKTLG